jgi:hypothetical protein
VLETTDNETGEAECATTQIVHCASSLELEWWCAANPYADDSVNNRHKHAICFKIERTKASRRGGSTLHRKWFQLQEFLRTTARK